jgi:PRC-barrel domain
LLAAPEQAADELERLWKEWNSAGRYEPLQALGVALGELIRIDQLPLPARARSLVCFGWIRSGRVAYAVLSFGGFLGMGDKLFAIPWNALTLDADNERFILDVPQERLQNAPGFDKNHWPSMADQRWATEVHSYYGTRPYWEL